MRSNVELSVGSMSVLLTDGSGYVTNYPKSQKDKTKWLDTNLRGISKVQYSMDKVRSYLDYATKRINQIFKHIGRLTRDFEPTNKPVLDCTTKGGGGGGRKP